MIRVPRVSTTCKKANERGLRLAAVGAGQLMRNVSPVGQLRGCTAVTADALLHQCAGPPNGLGLADADVRWKATSGHTMFGIVSGGVELRKGSIVGRFSGSQ